MSEIIKKAWTNEELEYLKNNYLAKTTKELSVELNRSESATQTKLQKMGLKRPDKYQYDVDYFKNIDTNEKAYWLGFWFADGFVSGNEATIELQEQDKYILERLNKDVKGNLPLQRVLREREYNHRIIKSDSYKIRFRRKEFIDNLINQGCVFNKTHTLNFPKNVPNSLMNDFIRGYFDGNGCVCAIKDRKEIRFYFSSGSHAMLVGIQNELQKNGISSHIRPQVGKCENLIITGIDNTKNFAKYIYDNAELYLDRKFNKFKYYYDLYDLQCRGR